MAFWAAVLRFHVGFVLFVVSFVVLAHLTSPQILSILESESHFLRLQKLALKGLKITEVPHISTKFKLEEQITDKQLAYMRYYGFIKFEGALDMPEVETIRQEKVRVETELNNKNITAINGVPLFRGTGTMNNSIHRIPFFTTRSKILHDIVHGGRFEPVKVLIAENGDASSVRIGDGEKDGAVFNTYLNLADSKTKNWARTQLGWHTDALREIAYFRTPKQMLNFGIHLDTVDPKHGDAALCLLPCTHNQVMWGFLFRKIYFLSNTADPKETCIPTIAGDVTVHDGRLWHRVEAATKTGLSSMRRSIYIPFLTNDQPVEIKKNSSAVPFYHRLTGVLRLFGGGM